MNIDKILFEQLNSSGKINKSFEDLDINNDGKINEQDENLATNVEIKNVISQILSSALDEEPELDIDNTNNFEGTQESQNKTIIQLQKQITVLTTQSEQLEKEQDNLKKEIEEKQKNKKKFKDKF